MSCPRCPHCQTATRVDMRLRLLAEKMNTILGPLEIVLDSTSELALKDVADEIEALAIAAHAEWMNGRNR